MYKSGVVMIGIMSSIRTVHLNSAFPCLLLTAIFLFNTTWCRGLWSCRLPRGRDEFNISVGNQRQRSSVRLVRPVSRVVDQLDKW